MALTYGEMEAVTKNWFLSKEAQDIYSQESFLVNYLLKQQKGLFRKVGGGRYIDIPLFYDLQNGGFYAKGDTLNSDDVTAVNKAQFAIKHVYGNATYYRIDRLENNGEYADVDLLTTRISGAQKKVSATIAGSIYDSPGGSSSRLTGLRALCNETSTTAYGGIAEDDLVATDGTKPWEGKMSSTTTAVSLDLILTLRRLAKVGDGPKGKPDLVVTTETIFQKFLSLLQIQQRLTEGKETAKAGFTGVWYAGCDIFPDDYCPSSHVFALNSNHLGIAIHKDGDFVRLPWSMVPDSPDDRTMKIFLDCNLITNNRKAHQGYSAVS